MYVGEMIYNSTNANSMIINANLKIDKMANTNPINNAKTEKVLITT